MKDSTSSIKNAYLPMGKVGLLLGSVIAGQWVINDLIHIPSGGIAVVMAGAGVWFLSKKSFQGSFQQPNSVKGWIKRCKEVLEHFESLEDGSVHSEKTLAREIALQEIIAPQEQQSLSLISAEDITFPYIDLFQENISSSKKLSLEFSSSLPINNKSWYFPDHLFEKDLVIYYLELPLRAVDLLWLEKIPSDLPAWVLISSTDSEESLIEINALKSQLPNRWRDRILAFDKSKENMKKVLRPVISSLEKTKKNIDFTRQRLLSRLHSSWQSELETLRRDKFRNIQNKSQWIVAGAVFASPVPSTDLLSVAVVNGLMIQEMSNLWSCKFNPDLLNAVARQLAIAALSQGVVEWSGQALLGVAKLHSGTWLAAGAMQALSAAYLTRVVGTSMADWMALNNGVSKPDLELLKIQAPELITKAAEKEKVDWSSFIVQSKEWIKGNNQIQPQIG